jgi:hypothetical protein
MYGNKISGAGAGYGAESPRVAAPTGSRKDAPSWYNRVAQAWGAALDRQAEKTVQLSQELNSGNDGPGAAMLISAAAHQLTFLSTAASSVSNSIGEALQTLGRKQ